MFEKVDSNILAVIEATLSQCFFTAPGANIHIHFPATDDEFIKRATLGLSTLGLEYHSNKDDRKAPLLLGPTAAEAFLHLRISNPVIEALQKIRGIEPRKVSWQER